MGIARHKQLRSDLGFSPLQGIILNFSSALLSPLANAAATSQESPSKFLIVAKTRTTIASYQKLGVDIILRL
jgi:hypothetical protein